ncbi:MAG TPA: M3 family metallopeptidase [Flavobacterium sp.]|nr:M3 family metallopeptidase [Flavobacterium sp.]
MKRKTLIILTTVVGIALQSCNKDKTSTSSVSNNQLTETWNTPFEVPPFEAIKNEHFKPAFLEAIEKHNEEIKAIAESTEAPTFENTIAAIESSGQLLGRVSSVFFNLKSSTTNDEIQALAQELAPTLSEHHDNINLNEKLFERVKKVYNDYAIQSAEKMNLTGEQRMLLDETYKGFVRSGANLSKENKDKLRDINKELSVFSLKYGDNLLKETKAYELIIDKKEDLAGLPNDLIEAAANEAKARKQEDKWVFTLDNASVMPFLQYAENRELRKKMWNAYQDRGNQGNAHDNKQNALQLANLRLEKAKLLGYANHAAYVLEESMAKNPENVNRLLQQLWTPALAKAANEANDIKAMMTKDGVTGDVMPYDWRFYAEKIRKERYDLDEQEIKPYFSLENVRLGIFDVTQKLFGLTFTELKNVPKYHEDVTVWEVKEANGTKVGVLYMDMHPRASKSGGAWMTSFSDQYTKDGNRVLPVISIVCNFSKPTADAPALLTFDEASTFFHEFGHALHGLLSNVHYKSLAGTNVPRDFVELPSQIMENWAADPEVIKMYAKHYKTGAAIPDALIAKMKAAGTFDQGFATTEYLAASLLDMKFHTITEPITTDLNAFEQTTMKNIGLMDAIIPRYRSTYFSHIFAGGYSAGYYSYIWSEVLDSDAFQAFKETSLFNPEKAKLFRTNVLEKGGTEDPAELYRKFRGADPKIEPLLKKRGLVN